MRVACLLAFAILGCTPAATSDDRGDAALENALERVSQLEAQLNAAGHNQQREVATSNPAPRLAERDPSPADLCWQDYCPCEPPQGGPDQGICRQLRAGLPVDDEMMAGAAMMRDARRQLEDFETDLGPF